MAANSVLFRIGTWAQYSNLAVRDPNTLYWIIDRLQLRKGEVLFGTGAEATATLAGLMSAEDKQKLDSITSGGASVPAYTLELQSAAEEGAVATYKLKQTVAGVSTYVGDAINIPKDRVLVGGSLAYAPADGNPYPSAEAGDPYLDLELNDPTSSHLYIPVKGLVDVPGAGSGISVAGNIVSIKLDPDNANGLRVSDAGVALDLATRSSAGAMSADDKSTLDRLSANQLQRNYKVIDTTNPAPIVKYSDGEIRIFYAADTAWASQQVGAGGNSKRYYMQFRAYAPEGAVSFREAADATAKAIPVDVTMDMLTGNPFAGMDEFGRKYSIVWLPVAKQNDDDSWTYFGVGSSNDKYIGWYYTVEWYDASGVLIGNDCIRINLSNLECHANELPYYMSKYATKDELREVSQTFEWGLIES